MSEGRTPSPEPQDLWSTILDSVASKRSLPTKNILLLGEPRVGKSTIAAALLQKQPTDAPDAHDFAIGCDWADVRDDADEDTLARLSLYTVPSSAPAHLSLIPHFLPPLQAITNTLVIIVLDWTQPHTFVDQLILWLGWLDSWSRGDGSRDLQLAREECRERLQSYLQHYTEAAPEPLVVPASNAALTSAVLPLGSGTLTHNESGLRIVVVCSKADLIDEEGERSSSIMVKGKGGEWEERTDAIMQVLRTICLKYGAGLFYTTQNANTLQALRRYALHLLFMSAPLPGSDGALSKNPFPMLTKANALDRDRIMIPIGWDSWGKISVLRDGFNPKLWGEAWEHDLEDQEAEGGVRSLYSGLVPVDHTAKAQKNPSLLLPIVEQIFLKEHWDENAKRPDRDPRAQFRNPTENTSNASSFGVVGPLGSVSFAMPNVASVLADIEGSSGAEQRKGAGARRDTVSRTGAPFTSTSRAPGSPSFATPPNSAGMAQHDVLHNFFQSLLTSNSRSGVRPQPLTTAPQTAGTTESPSPGETSGS